MDQVRTIAKVLWQQRFWVLSSIGSLVAVICWMSASGTLVDSFKKRQSEIKSSFSAVQSLISQPYLPNDKVNDGNSEQINLESQITLSIWEEMYGRQKEEVLYWPKDHLDETFIREIDKLKFADPFPPGNAQFMRGNYWNYIGERFDGLIEIVQALKTTSERNLRGGGGPSRMDFSGEGEGGRFMGPLARGGTEEEELDYLVQWLDQSNLQAQLSFPDKPSSLEIWVTQENLWVYETLLNVIAKTNKERGATRPDNTAVRIIVALEVGQDAISGGQSSMGNILMPLASSSSRTGRGGRGEMMDDEGMIRRGGGRPRGEGMFEEGDGESDTMLLEYRYLDPSTGDPLTGATGEFDSEFRLLPVRMVLMMEQTWLPHLLVECANAALPVEIKQLRINPSQSGDGFQTSGSRGGSRGVRGMNNLDMSDDSLAEVELQGVVYIYNKPDKSRLGIEGDDDQFADASGTNVQR